MPETSIDRLARALADRFMASLDGFQERVAERVAEEILERMGAPSGSRRDRPAPQAAPPPPRLPPAGPARTPQANAQRQRFRERQGWMLSSLADRGPLMAAELEAVAGLRRGSSMRHLADLIARGEIVREGCGRAVAYRLACVPPPVDPVRPRRSTASPRALAQGAETRDRLLTILAEAEGPVSARQLAGQSDRTMSSVVKALRPLILAGRVLRAGRGQYVTYSLSGAPWLVPAGPPGPPADPPAPGTAAPAPEVEHPPGAPAGPRPRPAARPAARRTGAVIPLPGRPGPGLRSSQSQAVGVAIPDAGLPAYHEEPVPLRGARWASLATWANTPPADQRLLRLLLSMGGASGDVAPETLGSAIWARASSASRIRERVESAERAGLVHATRERGSITGVRLTEHGARLAAEGSAA